MILYDNRTVGNTIRAMRKERNLTQEVLSGLAGIARSHLSMIEHGQKNANLETIWKIANALDLPPHVLIEQIEQRSETVD